MFCKKSATWFLCIPICQGMQKLLKILSWVVEPQAARDVMCCSSKSTEPLKCHKLNLSFNFKATKRTFNTVVENHWKVSFYSIASFIFNLKLWIFAPKLASVIFLTHYWTLCLFDLKYINHKESLWFHFKKYCCSYIIVKRITRFFYPAEQLDNKSPHNDGGAELKVHSNAFFVSFAM